MYAISYVEWIPSATSANAWRAGLAVVVAEPVPILDASQPWSEASQDVLVVLEDFVVESYGSRDQDLSQLFLSKKERRIKEHFVIADIEGQ
jgi:hypothetical protein